MQCFKRKISQGLRSSVPITISLPLHQHDQSHPWSTGVSVLIMFHCANVCSLHRYNHFYSLVFHCVSSHQHLVFHCANTVSLISLCMFKEFALPFFLILISVFKFYIIFYFNFWCLFPIFLHVKWLYNFWCSLQANSESDLLSVEAQIDFCSRIDCCSWTVSDSEASAVEVLTILHILSKIYYLSDHHVWSDQRSPRARTVQTEVHWEV